MELGTGTHRRRSRALKQYVTRGSKVRVWRSNSQQIAALCGRCDSCEITGGLAGTRQLRCPPFGVHSKNPSAISACNARDSPQSSVAVAAPVPPNGRRPSSFKNAFPVPRRRTPSHDYSAPWASSAWAIDPASIGRVLHRLLARLQPAEPSVASPAAMRPMRVWRGGVFCFVRCSELRLRRSGSLRLRR